MTDQNTLSGMAALSICEALLLAMDDHKLLPEGEIVGILSDAAASHQNVVGPTDVTDMHFAVAAIINRIIAGSNSVPRT